MQIIRTGKMKLENIKHIENSRLRNCDDVGELLQSIKEQGQLQNISIRMEDNVLIFGNRRVKAFEKLGLKEINADFCTDVSNEDILLLNLIENIQRKSINSIEIGRICKELEKKKMTQTEISKKLGISVGRVSGCIVAFDNLAGTEFENIIVFGKRGKQSGIPETLLWKIWSSLSRARILTKNDWRILIQEIEKGKFTTHHVSELRKILLYDKTLTISEALKMLEKCYVCHLTIPFNLQQMNNALSKEKVSSGQELMKEIIKKYDKNLIY